MVALKKTMFREYDIRGRESDDELNERALYTIARGFGAMLRAKNVKSAVVGHDARGTSERFHTETARGLLESGIDVIDIGTVTTPMSYWAQYHLKVDGLCMITASHNPAGWNGLKLGTRPSSTLLPDEIKKLYDIIEKEEYVEGSGKIRKENIKDAYIDDLLSRVHIAKPLRVLVNTGNGTAGLFAPELIKKSGCEVVEHYTNVDPTYPHYTANPAGLAMMEDTGTETTTHNCDIGLAFDGDGDRLGIVDEKGNIVWPDRYLILLSRLVLAKKPGAKIVFDVTVSEALPDDIIAHGGIPIMARTGHSYIKSKMAEERAPLAGEGSGHVFFGPDMHYGFDDAFFAALKLLEYVTKQEKPVSELVAETPTYISTTIMHAETPDEMKYQIVDKLTEEFRADGHRVVDISGARVYVEDGWGLIRASSNMPSIVLRFEAKTQEGLDRIQKMFRDKLARFPDVSTHWDTLG